MVIHILTSQGEKMVVQVVDGDVIVPQAASNDQHDAGDAQSLD
jgi:hypothetical protein